MRLMTAVPERADQPSQPPEAFGQAGVRRFAPAVLGRIVLVFLIVSVLMWHRSHSTADQLVRDGATHTWVVRSIYGRIVIQRLDRDPDSPPSQWSIDSFDVRRPIRDGWAPSWQKAIGLQWGHDVGDRGQTFWWLRVRWPTLSLVFAVLTLYLAVKLRRRTEQRTD